MTARAISIEAYHAHIESGKADTQWIAIRKFLEHVPHKRRFYVEGWTRRELAEYLVGMPINVVCGRVKELLDAGLIVELPRRRCTVTGHMAHPVTVAK